MYEQGEEALKRILALVDLCPEPLRGDAFKILLEGYVRGALPAPANKNPGDTKQHTSAAPLNPAIPPDVQTRLGAMGKRRSVEPEKIAALFDFSADPFTFAPLNVEGKNTSERAKRVALLVAARSFLATGKWVGDWAEVKAMASHQNCYDVNNFAGVLKKLKGKQFKGVTPGESVELSATGTEEAEKLIAKLAAA